MSFKKKFVLPLLVGELQTIHSHPIIQVVILITLETVNCLKKYIIVEHFQIEIGEKYIQNSSMINCIFILQ